MSKKSTVRVPVLDPRSSQQLVGGVRQSVANGQRVADPQPVTEPVSKTIRPGRPVRRVVHHVLRDLGLTARRGHG
jgi:hypothetical protein